jgi:hypothetical protein
VDSHLEPVPRLRPFTTRCLSCSNSQSLQHKDKDGVLGHWKSTSLEDKKPPPNTRYFVRARRIWFSGMYFYQPSPHAEITRSCGHRKRPHPGPGPHLGRHADRSFHFEVLFLGASDQVSTHCREGKAPPFTQNHCKRR